MVLDDLSNAQRYIALHSQFAAAFEYLHSRRLAELPEGRHEIDGERLFVLVARSPGKGREAARLECHRRYIDIQVTIEGQEEIGWRELGECRQIDEPYVDERDIAFYADRPETWLVMPPGKFAIFYPHDAHAPLAGRGEVFKAVVKVAAR